jgi:large subunit ribosomal protein L1
MPDLTAADIEALFAPSLAPRAAWASRWRVCNHGKLSKKQKALASKVVPQKLYPLQEALTLAKETATAKFDESIDVAVNLGVDARKSDQVVRGSVVLPAGTGKSVRVAVFAQGDKAEAAKAAGAEVVGFDDLAAEVKAGNLISMSSSPRRMP